MPSVYEALKREGNKTIYETLIYHIEDMTTIRVRDEGCLLRKRIVFNGN